MVTHGFVWSREGMVVKGAVRALHCGVMSGSVTARSGEATKRKGRVEQGIVTCGNGKAWQSNAVQGNATAKSGLVT